MSRYRVYIKPFVAEGVYADDFIDISDDVIQLGDVTQSLDNTTYDIGVFKNSGIKIRLRNDHGRFSESTVSKSIFKDKRQDAIVRVTWSIQLYPMRPGFMTVTGSQPIGDEQTIFEGLLSDITSESSITDQYVDFRVSGYDSIIDRMAVPFSSISNGDTFSESIFTMLNQTLLTTYVTVDQNNISCQVDEEIDDKSDLEGQTVREALDSGKLLLASSSVLYIENNVVYVESRQENTPLAYTFYGQASINGIENIIDIKGYRDGVNRIFNYVQWRDTGSIAQETGSQSRYGIRKTSVESPLINDGSTAKVNNIVEEIRDDFSEAKRELKLLTPLTYDTLALNLKDKVSVDYPTIYTSADANPIPRWGQSTTVWGDFIWPIGQYSLTIEASARFKIMSKKISTKNDTIEFLLRET